MEAKKPETRTTKKKDTRAVRMEELAATEKKIGRDIEVLHMSSAAVEVFTKAVTDDCVIRIAYGKAIELVMLAMDDVAEHLSELKRIIVNMLDEMG